MRHARDPRAVMVGVVLFLVFGAVSGSMGQTPDEVRAKADQLVYEAYKGCTENGWSLESQKAYLAAAEQAQQMLNDAGIPDANIDQLVKDITRDVANLEAAQPPPDIVPEVPEPPQPEPPEPEPPEPEPPEPEPTTDPPPSVVPPTGVSSEPVILPSPGSFPASILLDPLMSGNETVQQTIENIHRKPTSKIFKPEKIRPFIRRNREDSFVPSGR